MDAVLRYLSGLRRALDQVPVPVVELIIRALVEARIHGSQVFILGNGGSAATASHFVCDLAKGTRQAGLPPYRATSLNENIPLLSAYGNDEGFENIFSSQLESLVRPGDVVIGLSTSGNSENVLKAVQLANHLGALTIGFTGFDGGALGSLVDIHLHIPSTNIEQVEDIHLMLAHLICTALREVFSGERAGPAPIELNAMLDRTSVHA